jgi:hypothetical protein
VVDHRLDHVEHLDGGDLVIDRSDANGHLFVHAKEPAEVIFGLELDDDEGWTQMVQCFPCQLLCDSRNCAEPEPEIEGAGTGTGGRLLGRVAPHELVSFESSEGQDDIRVVCRFEEFLMIGESQGSFWWLNQVYRMDMAYVNRHEQVILTGRIVPASREYKRGFISDHKDQAQSPRAGRSALD